LQFFVLLLSDTLCQLLILLDYPFLYARDRLAELLQLDLLGLSQLQYFLGFGLAWFSRHLLGQGVFRCELAFVVFNKTEWVLFGWGLD
jgi:hypothetical protein